MILLMMRSYFCIDLKGKSLFLPFLAAWAAAVGGTLLFLRFAERYASPEPLLDWSFAAFAVCCLLFVVVMQAACCFALYFFVRATAGGMALSGERFEADYPPRRYAALCTKGILLGTVTLGVYLPWFIRDVVRYFAEGTSFRFHALEFRGSASALFSYAVLLCVAPAFVVYSLVPVVMMRASAGTEGMYVLCWFLYILLLAFVCGWNSACQLAADAFCPKLYHFY